MRMPREFRGKRAKRAQMQIMEIITAGLVLLSALNFVASLPPTIATGGQSSEALQEDGQSTLRTLANLPSDLGYTSLLEECIVLGDISTVTDHINLTLGETISYNLFLYPDDFGAQALMLFKSGESLGEATSAHHPVILSERAAIPDFEHHTHTSLKPGVYDIVLLMWYEPREVPE